MSAFLCSASHLSAIIKAASWGQHRGMGMILVRHIPADYRAAQPDLELALFDLLRDENLKSLNYRYPSYKNEPEQWGMTTSDAAYRFRRDVAKPSVVQALKLCHCYEYQSCEHPEWPESAACKFIDALRTHLEHWVVGYDDATWHLDSTPEPPPHRPRTLTLAL